MATEIAQLEPDETPLTVLTARIRTARSTHNPRFTWWEDELMPRFDAVDTTTGVGTAVRVDTAAKFTVHDLVKVSRTGELMRVTAIAAPNLTVERGIGAAAVALADNDELIIVGSAQPEGDDTPTAKSQNPVEITNYTQITRTSFAATETLRHSDSNTNPSDWNYVAGRAMIKHKLKLEDTRWHGKPSENLSGGANGLGLRTAGGVFHFVTQNITSVGGVLTEATFWGTQRRAFRYGSPNKVLFCSGIVLEALNGFARSKLDLIQGDNDATYGLRIFRIVGPFGALDLVYNKRFEGSGFGGHGVMLDMGLLKKRYLANAEGSRDTHILTNRQANGIDARVDEVLTEDSLEFGLDLAHAMFTGVTG
jgi:hypothetical protein